MDPRPTLDEVAGLAGVSTATVSRVLNNSAPVSDAMRASVEAAVAQLGYVPNRAARNLARRRTDTIAVVASAPDDRFFADPFFAAMVHGISEALAETDLQFVILTARGEREQRKVERYVLEGHVDATIMLCTHERDVLPRSLADAGAPFVLVGRPSGGDPATAYVDTDNRTGGRIATEHLLAERERVATIAGPPDMVVSIDRLAGYRDALAGRPELVAHGDFTAASGASAMRALLDREPALDAVFAASDEMAAGAIEALAEAGRSVPDDVAVVGFDDLELASRLTPPLTTMRQPWGRLAGSLVELACLRIDGDRAPRSVVLAPVLVRRASA